jgi:hypothetical protein
LRVNDLIQEVDHKPIKSVDDLHNAMEDVLKRKADTVLMKVLRGIYTVYVELEPKWDKQ